MGRAGAVFRTIRRRWRRLLVIVLLIVIASYAILYAVVALHTSPADQAIQLADGRSVAYLTLSGRPPFAPAPAAAEPSRQRVILLHGAPADVSGWSRLAQQDLSGLDVVAVDRLGYGNSTPGTVTSLQEQAEAILPFLETPAVVVGHSHGGPIALRVAAEYPDRVAGVVLVAGACDARMNDAQWARKLVDLLSPIVPESWAVANRELLALTDENQSMQPLLERIRSPVTVVHGEWDAVCPHDGTISYLQEMLVGADHLRVRSLPRAGHNLHLSHAALIAEEIHRLAERRLTIPPGD